MSLPVFAARWLAAVFPTAAVALLSLILPLAAPRASAAGPEPSPSATPVEASLPAATPVATPTPAPDIKNPLGATPQEIVKFYGPVLKHNARVRRHQVLEGGTALDGDLHGRNGLVIRVVYHEGHVIMLEFTKVGGALTQPDVNALLATVAGNSAWALGKDSTDAAKMYRRADDRAVAHYATDNDGSLLVAAEGLDHDKLLDNMLH